MKPAQRTETTLKPNPMQATWDNTQDEPSTSAIDNTFSRRQMVSTEVLNEEDPFATYGTLPCEYPNITKRLALKPNAWGYCAGTGRKGIGWRVTIGCGLEDPCQQASDSYLIYLRSRQGDATRYHRRNMHVLSNRNLIPALAILS
jgi:hypothetical protein